MTEIFESGEMYLEDILILREKNDHVRSIDIVNYTGYSKPSISRAIGLLRRKNMINVDGDGYITLTAEGEKLAGKIYERHRYLTWFFEELGVSPETAASDACKIEHDISDEAFEKIKEHIRKMRKEDGKEEKKS